MADYDQTIWLPRSDPASFPATAALLNKLEAGLKDAAQNSKQRGPIGARPLAGLAVKNWLWIDSATEQLSYCDGAAWRDIGAAAASGVSVATSERVGAVITWTGKTVPDDCLLANGQTFAQAAWPELYAHAQKEVAAGNTLWTVTGTNATVPDLRDRFLYGAGTAVLGAKAGAATVALAPAETPLRDHTHGPGTLAGGQRTTAAGTTTAGTGIPPHNSVATGANGAITPLIGNTGSPSVGQANGAAHENMPPYCVLAFVIKAKSGSVSTNPAKRVKGRVNADATIAQGAGLFTVTKVQAGLYEITTATPFGVTPVVQVFSGWNAQEYPLAVGGDPLKTFRVGIKNDAGALTDFAFSFVAEDPGLGLQATMDLEGWRAVGATGQPAFQNAWVNYGGSYPPARFRKTPDGMVHLDGQVKSGVIGLTSAIFTLPVGYRPAFTKNIVVVSNGAHGQIVINTDGTVMAYIGSNLSFSLENVHFFTD